MGFLDNSGDIILDAVLTDLGRMRLAEGNGTFNVTKFAFGDEEINYGLWNGNHPSGSAYYDLEIIQTPILESFTNNTSTMKSRLMSYDNNRLFFLPTLKLNSDNANGAVNQDEEIHLIAVDAVTQGTDVQSGYAASLGGGGVNPGVLMGFTPSAVGDAMIVVDQGMDNELYPDNQQLVTDDLIETGYTIEINSKFGTIVDRVGNVLTRTVGTQGNQQNITLGSKDDDDMVLYTIISTDTSVYEAAPTGPFVHAGANGSRLHFKVQASTILSSNDSYFDRYGFVKDIQMNNGATVSMKCIDTIIRVTGVKLGNSIDIPVRFVKHAKQ